MGIQRVENIAVYLESHCLFCRGDLTGTPMQSSKSSNMKRASVHAAGTSIDAIHAHSANKR